MKTGNRWLCHCLWIFGVAISRAKEVVNQILVVEPMGCRTNGLSNQWAVGPMGCRTNGLSNQWAVGLVGRNLTDEDDIVRSLICWDNNKAVMEISQLTRNNFIIKIESGLVLTDLLTI